MDGQAEALADVFCRCTYGVALVEVTEGLQDDFERVGAALPRGARAEEYGAAVAVPALEDFELFVALACPDNVDTRALEAALESGADEGAAVRIVAGFGRAP
jgi:hypothetical protein